jgi:two-component system response regulator MprA
MPAGRPRVLMVDDDRDCRAVLVEALALEGYAIREAINGRDALAVIGDWRPDLIILDLRMPELDGPAFREKQLGNGMADIPVLVVTAAGDPDRCAEELAAPVMPKPFDLDPLLAEVRRLLGGGPPQGERGRPAPA